ncbi:bifunctional oligoribonuclease/PAP phosphatase NrnA [Clostridium sp. MSJ-11]|uniref:Bifunctional oligoribonuclease/PAP phosphatase NrnA n=1 Tax=Clostridium mobile TaxID=2841512 RepID=A0ABS6ECK3_9CLOT|nr:bifunctional oligoribonuclease/PAP phosphatase NrnA [Clostridium mobile]MBU5482788.1 bifunctional oligoribonuclease/PAP phosphatase NrnA [Clostridium mobile]
MIMNNILKIIKESKKIAISFHTSPDGDSLGSSLGLLQGIRKLNKFAYILCKESIPDNFTFLPYSNEVIESTGNVLEGTDCVIVLDCGNTARINGNIELGSKEYTIINIDHHVSNELYGHLNYVDTNSACMGEIVYQMLKDLSIEVDRDIATCLYTSILTDTGSFRYSNTTSVTHSIAGELINTGIDFSSIHRLVFDSKAFDRFKLYGMVFDTMELINNQICVMTVTTDMFTKLNIDPGTDTSDIVSFGNSIKPVEITILLKEKENEVKISLRSKSKIDVRKIAESLGGGGHIRAAGASIKNKSLIEVKNILIELAENELM